MLILLGCNPEKLSYKRSYFYISRAAAAHYPNFCTQIDDNCTDPSCFKGISGEVWKTLAENLNFTYTVSKETSWGSMSNDSGIVTWSGMIGTISLKLY